MEWFQKMIQRMGHAPAEMTAGMTPDQIAQLQRRRGWGQVAQSFGDAAEAYGDVMNQPRPERRNYEGQFSRPEPVQQSMSGGPGITYSNIDYGSRRRQSVASPGFSTSADEIARRRMLIDALMRG